MERENSQENVWDESKLKKRSISPAHIILIGTLSLITFGGYMHFTKLESVDDARLAYIKRNYEQSLTIINEIIDNPDRYIDHEAALQIKSEIFLDKKGEYYDQSAGLATLRDLFDNSRNVETARKILSLSDSQKLSEKATLKYLEYLANQNDVEAIDKLSKIYLKSDDYRLQMKAKDYLTRLPDTSEKLLNLAKIELISGKSRKTVANAETYLNTAILLGSSVAMAELAFVQLIEAEVDKLGSARHKADFVNMMRKAVEMGYRGERLPEAARILKFGRKGVPQDTSFAKQIEQFIENDKTK